MVASDQNKVFDTGDPGPRASGPAPGPLGNNGAAQVPQHGPPGPGVLGLVVAVPASLPVQPIGADLIKMQDLLLSQKREELFGKKKKNKNKPNKNLVKTTATVTSQEVVVVDRNNHNNLPQSIANHSASSGSSTSGSKPSVEEPRPPRKKVKKAENNGDFNTTSSPSSSNVTTESIAVNNPVAGSSSNSPQKSGDLLAPANNSKISPVICNNNAGASTSKNGEIFAIKTEIPSTSAGSASDFSKKSVFKNESRPPKRLFKARGQWDENEPQASKSKPEPAVGNAKTQKCFQCSEDEITSDLTENGGIVQDQIILHLLVKHGIKGKICSDCQLIFRRLKSHHCYHQDVNQDNLDPVPPSSLLDNAPNSADIDLTENFENLKSTGNGNAAAADPYAFDEFGEDEFNVPVMSMLQPLKTYSRKIGSGSPFSSSSSRRNSDVEFLPAILKNKLNNVESELSESEEKEFRENVTSPVTDTDAESFKSAKSTLTTPAMATPEPFENTDTDYSKKDDGINDTKNDNDTTADNIPSDSSLLKSSEKTRKKSVKRKKAVGLQHVNPVGNFASKQCMQCSTNNFKKRLHLVTHLRKEHDLKVKFCKLCNFIFIQKDFKKHICSGKPSEKDAAAGIPTTTEISEKNAVGDLTEDDTTGNDNTTTTDILSDSSLLLTPDILSDSSLVLETGQKRNKKSEKKKRSPALAHVNPVGNVTSKQCMQCSQNNFKKRLHLLTHLRKEHDLKVRFCKLCNLIFIQKDFKKHICSGKSLEKDTAGGMTTTTKISEKDAAGDLTENEEKNDATTGNDNTTTTDILSDSSLLLTPEKRKRRAPSRLISEDEPPPILSPKSPKSPSPKSPSLPKSRNDLTENFENLKSVTAGNGIVTSTPNKSSEITPQKIKKAQRYYKPEHTQMLFELYEKSNKYPSKEEMNEVAKVIGVLPIKILWWFTHRRRMDKKKEGGDLTENKNSSSDKQSSIIKNSISGSDDADFRPKKIQIIQRVDHKKTTTNAYQEKIDEKFSSKIVDLNDDGQKTSSNEVTVIKLLKNKSESDSEQKRTTRSSAVVTSEVNHATHGTSSSNNSKIPANSNITIAARKQCQWCGRQISYTNFSKHVKICQLNPESTNYNPNAVKPEPKIFRENEDNLEPQNNSNNAKEIRSKSPEISSNKRTTRSTTTSELKNVIHATSQKNPVGDVSSKQCLECFKNKFVKRLHLMIHLRKDHGLKVKYCKPCNFIFKLKDFKSHSCVERQDGGLTSDSNLDTSYSTSTSSTPSPVKITTPNKNFQKTKPTFFSRRYRNLLQEFSPKKNQSANQDLGEMLTKTSFYRNGKLALNYVTPTQLKAVEQFLFGDFSDEKVYLTNSF